MKTTAWTIAAGSALGLAAILAPAASARATETSAITFAGDTVDLTPRYKAGQTITFKQHTVRADTFTIPNMPNPTKVSPKPEGGAKDQEPAKEGAAPTDAPKSDPGKKDAAIVGAAKLDPPKSDAPASPKPDAEAKADQPKTLSSTTTVDLTATYELRVKEVGAQGATMELELKSIVAGGDLPQGKVSWDSSTPPDDKDAHNPLLVAFRPIVGAVMTIKLGADGNITSVDGDSRVNLNARGTLAPHVQALVGPDGVRTRWGPVLWIKDGTQPAAIGQSWSNTDTLPFPAVGKFSFITNNTLKGVKDGVADIAITGEITLGPMEAGKPAAGKLREQSLKGSCQWDTSVGGVKTYTMQQKQTLDLNAGGIAVSRSSDATVTTTRQ